MVSLCDGIIAVQTSNVSECPTFTLRVLGFNLLHDGLSRGCKNSLCTPTVSICSSWYIPRALLAHVSCVLPATDSRPPEVVDYQVVAISGST